MSVLVCIHICMFIHSLYARLHKHTYVIACVYIGIYTHIL